MYVTVPIIFGKGTTGVVFLSHDINDIYSEMASFGWKLAGVALGFMLIIILLGYLMAGKIVAPLVELTKAIKLMGEGYLRQRLVVRGNDEVARLAGSFNEMSRELEKGDEELRAFVANASHELRSPVSSLKALAEAAIIQPENEKVHEFLGDMNNEIDRLARLIQELLMLSRLENRKFTWEPERTDFSSCVKNTVERLKGEAQKKNITFYHKIEKNLYLKGQGILLERLVHNLIDNAIKYTNEEGNVSVTAYRTTEGIVLKVADSGIGIPLHARELVWERFYRQDKARSREMGGAGLGLTLVRQIAELHRAGIELESEEGKGTVFTVLFPPE
jgi:signal transduction histidine kinase